MLITLQNRINVKNEGVGEPDEEKRVFLQVIQRIK
jgi:hypothetical protein